MKQAFLVMAALLAGFIGGILGERVARTRQQPHTEQLVRARSFELVDETGKTISYWGIDKGNNAVLAFGSHWPLPPPAGVGGQYPVGLDDPHNQRAAIGVIDDGPFLFMRGADGKTRVRMYLSIDGKPILMMEDENSWRVALGIDQSDTPGPQDNDWALQFYPERVWLGMHTFKEGGQTVVQGGYSVNRDKLKYPFQQPK
jgi:hypothetical protein